MSFMDIVHGTLDVAGMVPLIGEIADGTNAGLYALQGDMLNAGISLAGMLPIGGQAVTGTRLGVKVGKEVLDASAKKAGKEVLGEATEQGVKKAGKEGGERASKEIGTKISRKKPRKPHKPNKKKWEENGGKVVDNPDGSTTYISKDGDTVSYGKDGYPDFSPHASKEVTIDPMTGVGKGDFNRANEAAGLSKTPDGYTWHHVQDGKTMQLVPSNVHQTFPHSGGASAARNQS